MDVVFVTIVGIQGGKSCKDGKGCKGSRVIVRDGM